MSPLRVAALGVGQLINWGVLYYAFAVLLPPVRAALDVPAWVVTGALSLALLASAAAAPAVGRWADRGGAPRAIALGSAGGALLLVLWAAAPSVVMLYVVWAGLGVCMAAALYEPAFAVIARSPGSSQARRQSLAVVTLIGGLASTVFLPLTAALVVVAGWRGTSLALAALLGLSAALAFTALRSVDQHVSGPGGLCGERWSCPRPGSLAAALVVFGVSTMASASFTANLIPMLAERAIDPTTAGLLGGLFGVMQLPGRALLLDPRARLSGPALLRASLWLQAAGAFAVAALPTTAAVAVGIAVFAAGSGLTTLARPYVVQEAFALEHCGYVNGRLARAQQVTRALGPIAASGLAGVAGYACVLLVLAGVLVLLPFVSRPRTRRP
jgi:MFS family permease